MSWLLDQDNLAYGTWVGLAATLIGLALTWIQARDAGRMASKARSASEAAATAAIEARQKIQERLLLSDIQSAVAHLQNLRAIVLSSAHDNMVHVSNVYRSHVNRTFRAASEQQAGDATIGDRRKDLAVVWKLADETARGTITPRKVDRLLECLQSVEEFLAESGDRLTFTVLGERANGAEISE